MADPASHLDHTEHPHDHSHVDSDFTGTSFSVASIELKGEPYQQLVDDEFISSSDTLESLAERSGYRQRVAETLRLRREWLEPIESDGFGGLLRRMEDHAQPLTFEEAYAAMAHVCAGSNKMLRGELAEIFPSESYRGSLFESYTQAVELLKAASDREAAVGFTSEELAGLVAATIELDTIMRVDTPNGDTVFALGGMGGDRGIHYNGKKLKTANVSTLAMLGLASYGAVHKHHSYPNTSKVAGQSAIEAFGARSDFSAPGALQELMDQGLLASSCHSLRTVHSISHVLKGETINHAIGPLAIPHGAEHPLHPLVGVNHNVHPETILGTLNILQERGIQRYEGGVAFCAVDSVDELIPEELFDENKFYQEERLKELVLLDEVAPPPYSTMASFLTRDGVRTVLLHPTDFMTEDELAELHVEALTIPNTAEAIMDANHGVVDGTQESQVKYVAMTIALGIFSKIAWEKPGLCFDGERSVDATVLRHCFGVAVSHLRRGEMRKTLDAYVAATRRVAG